MEKDQQHLLRIAELAAPLRMRWPIGTKTSYATSTGWLKNELDAQEPLAAFANIAKNTAADRLGAEIGGCAR
jgi:hypothetical protein